MNEPLVLDSQLEVGTEVGFDSGPPCKKLCFTRETRILATRLSVSGIWVLLYRVDPVDMSRVSLGRCGVWRNVERPLVFVKMWGGDLGGRRGVTTPSSSSFGRRGADRRRCRHAR